METKTDLWTTEDMIGYNEAERLDSILKSTPGLKLTYKELIA